MESVKYIVSEIKVAYHPKAKNHERPQINSSSDALIYLLDGYDRNTIALQEQFVVAYLSQSSRILGIYRASIGGISGTVADTRLILSVALRIGSTALILSHNHPSGNLKPSRSDEELTYKIKEAAKFMDCKILDHLIISPCGTKYYSFADEALL